MNNLTKYRKKAGLTQQQLADKIGVNIRQIQKYEGGEAYIGNMTLANAVAIADVLGIHPKQLIEINIIKIQYRTATADMLAGTEPYTTDYQIIDAEAESDDEAIEISKDWLVEQVRMYSDFDAEIDNDVVNVLDDDENIIEQYYDFEIAEVEVEEV